MKFNLEHSETLPSEEVTFLKDVCDQGTDFYNVYYALLEYYQDTEKYVVRKNGCLHICNEKGFRVASLKPEDKA